MFDRFFSEIDATRARAARDAGLPDPARTAPRPTHPLVRWLNRLPLLWIFVLLLLLVFGERVEEWSWITPLVLFPAVALRLGSLVGLVSERLISPRVTREGALLAVVLWLLSALIILGRGVGNLTLIASLLLLLLLARRIHRAVLGGMYLVERNRIRRGQGPSAAIAESRADLDGTTPGAETINQVGREEETP